MPSYPEIRLALPPPGAVTRKLDEVNPDAVHIATEGPLGHAMRRVCIKRGLPFTTTFHTCFPDYLAERLPLPERWTGALAWAWLRRFHEPGAAVMAATPTLAQELVSRGFKNVKIWPRGVDAQLFHPRQQIVSDLARPIFLTVGRLAVEKNVEAFLALDLPVASWWLATGRRARTSRGSIPKWCSWARGRARRWQKIYASTDVFVFPNRTDTYGLVLLEALTSGVPVAAFPAAAPRDVIGDAPVGVLDEDLQRACLEALECSREECRAFALKMTWEASARIFVGHVAEATKAVRLKENACWLNSRCDEPCRTGRGGASVPLWATSTKRFCRQPLILWSLRNVSPASRCARR
jgi:1,2-diacylglycerol 3-alpha-glucosyltransferase/glucuronosyltransferase